MRQNFRKILTMLTVSAAALGLTACGSTAAETDELSYDEAYLESVADFLIGNWDGMSDEQIAQYAEMDAEDAQGILDNYGLPFTAEAFTTAFSGYMGNEEELGAYVSTDGYEVSTDGKEITLVAHLTYEHLYKSSYEYDPWYGNCIQCADLHQPCYLLLQLHSGYPEEVQQEERAVCSGSGQSSSSGPGSSSG